MELEVGQPGVCQNHRSPVLGSGGTAVEVGPRLIQPASAVDTPSRGSVSQSREKGFSTAGGEPALR